MIFTSYGYALFLPVVFLLYWALPHKYRYIMLTIASLMFYMFGGPAYVGLIIADAFITWYAARAVYRTQDDKKKKAVLITALILCLGMLAFFKYFNFAADTFFAVLRAFSVPVQDVTAKILMPAGISFFTFQAAGYCIDVYRGKVAPENNFIKYLLFVSFFPQIMSGPIGRAGDLMPQLFEERQFDEVKASEGLRQMLWGYAKKLVLADLLTIYVDYIFDNVRFYFGLTLIVATVFFTIQIYCDFSGYSDIAIGTAKLFNIDLMTNFKSPYYSRTVREFWSRWHISLSTWFRDYVYIPLGGNRCSELRNYFNLLTTFLLSGLWHGASWTYVLWGALHGVYQVTEDFCHRHLGKKEYRNMKERDIKRSIPWNIGHGILTFGLVSFAWSFFRANSVQDIFYIVSHMPRGLGHPVNSYIMMLNDTTLYTGKLLRILMCVAVVMAVDFIALKKNIFAEFGKLKMPVRWIVYVGLTTFVIVVALNGGVKQQFIYFQF
ncbi:MAG: MBOAT family protein [Lachnospiraceae bacterium]|nr:MBOAT family protein [Lachnospiraceae bacterium]